MFPSSITTECALFSALGVTSCNTSWCVIFVRGFVQDDTMQQNQTEPNTGQAHFFLFHFVALNLCWHTPTFCLSLLSVRGLRDVFTPHWTAGVGSRELCSVTWDDRPYSFVSCMKSLLLQVLVWPCRMWVRQFSNCSLFVCLTLKDTESLCVHVGMQLFACGQQGGGGSHRHVDWLFIPPKKRSSCNNLVLIGGDMLSGN